MKTSQTSFLDLMQDISEAISRKESATDYDNLLGKIFERAPNDAPVKDTNWQSEEIFGRDDEKLILLSRLIDSDRRSSQLSVISILGGSGIGKTTIARLVYNSEAVMEYFELRAWVKLEGQEFRLQAAAQGLLKSAAGISCALIDLEELDEMVRDILQSQRCLIVFDGIDSITEDSWLHVERLWFRVVGLGSKILITTTSNDVAYLIDKDPFVLKKLSPYAGRSLCIYFSFDPLKSLESMDINLDTLCRGIPLCLKLVGGLMSDDDELIDLFVSADFSNDNILKQLDFDESVVILLCIWALPPHLRQCLSYCAIFPTGYAFNLQKIIDMWIAKGLVKLSAMDNSLVHIADTYFHQLLSRSFFTDIIYNQYDKIIEFRIPGLIHKVAKDVARIVYKEMLGEISTISEDASKLSLALPFSGSYNSKHLNTLILSPTIHLGASLDHSLLDFKELHSLDLSCSGIQNLSDDIRFLKELRCLNLSCTPIERLPDSITDLSELRTLDLSNCYHLKVLPRGTSNLRQMTHLDLWLCESLSHLPSGIGSLRFLSSMPLFVLGTDLDCASLSELQGLNQLRGRLEIRNLENVRNFKEAREAMMKQKYLHHLGLSWSRNSDNCFALLELLEPNEVLLEVLELTGYKGSWFPHWIQRLNWVIKITINDCGCEKLPSLGQLPVLKELQLKGMPNIKRIGPEFYGGNNGDIFPSLEQLELCDLPRLLSWKAAIPHNSFTGLKTLTIEGCPHLRSFPSLPTLPNLIVCNNHRQIISSLTTFSSLSSLLIKSMELGSSNLDCLSWLHSLKKLTLFSVNDSHEFFFPGFDTLEHLSILHCDHLLDMSLKNTSSLEKLHVVGCPHFSRIYFEEQCPVFVELVVEDCPTLEFTSFHSPLSLRKLIIKNSDAFRLEPLQLKFQEELEYLFISGCPQLHRRLQMEPSITSHIPCVVMDIGNSTEPTTGDMLSKPDPSTEDLPHFEPWQQKSY